MVWFLSISQKLGRGNGFSQTYELQFIMCHCVRCENDCILRDVSAHASHEKDDCSYVDAHALHVYVSDAHDHDRENSQVRAARVSPP